jgi:hypothetical protein
MQFWPDMVRLQQGSGHTLQLICFADAYFYSSWQMAVRCKSCEGKNIMQCLFVLGSSSFVVFRETVMSIAVGSLFIKR